MLAHSADKPKKIKRPREEDDPAPLMEPPLMPGFSRSMAGYDQMKAHMLKWYGKHPQFRYEMEDFDPEHTVTLLDDEGKLMGFFGMWPSVQDASQRNPLHTYFTIDVLEVMEEYRGKGLGRRLLDQVVAIGRQGGYNYIRTYAVEEAFEFYINYGFSANKLVKGTNVCLKL